jgi:hypothetical protein
VVVIHSVQTSLFASPAAGDPGDFDVQTADQQHIDAGPDCRPVCDRVEPRDRGEPHKTGTKR